MSDLNSEPGLDDDEYLMYLSQCVIKETHLLNEERFLINSIIKIKEQCNHLQIERLHLENALAELKSSNGTKQQPSPSPSSMNEAMNLLNEVEFPTYSKMDDTTKESLNLEPLAGLTVNPITYKTNTKAETIADPAVGRMVEMLVESMSAERNAANTDQSSNDSFNLDLTTTVPYFRPLMEGISNPENNFDMVDNEDIIIDMNMLMHGAHNEEYIPTESEDEEVGSTTSS